MAFANSSDVSKSGWDWMSTPSVNISRHAMNDTIKGTISTLNESMAWDLNTTPTSAMDYVNAEESLPAAIDEVLSMVFGTNNDTALVIIPGINPMAVSMEELSRVRIITAIMMTVAFAMVNLAMGAAIGKVELMRQWRVPGAVLVGSIIQFLVFPLVALAIVRMFKLPTPYVTGMLLVAICPGGAMANLVTFFIDGSISVCTSMVLISTVVSMGYVPVMLLIISGGFASASVAVSMWAVGVAIFIIAVPLGLGVIIRSYKESWAHVITMIGITVGLLVYISNSLVQLFIHTQIFHAPSRVYIATALVVICGFIIAMFVAYLFGQHPTSRHTLAVHTVFHNTSLTIVILCTVFFDDPHWRQLIVIPSIYGPISGLFGIIYIIVYLAVGINSEEGSHHEAYQPINEEPQGNVEYNALEGDDDDMKVKIKMAGFRLKVKGYEEMDGTVSPLSTTGY